MQLPFIPKSSRVEIARKATYRAILFNLLLVFIKGSAGLVGNSWALVADAVESLTDVASSGAVLFGLKLAEKPPTEKYPFGKGRAETLSASFVAIFLFIAAFFVARQSIIQIFTPHEAPQSFTLFVLIGVVLVKEGMFRYSKRIGDSTGSRAVHSDAWHHRSDAITSLAAFIGILVALLGGPGYESADDWAALAAAGVIVMTGIGILKPAFGELLDRSDPDLVQAIREVALGVPQVYNTHKCRVRKLGFDTYVDLDVVVNGALTVREGHAVAHRVQDTICSEIPSITQVLVHIEPANSDEPQ